jgi:hypothetical protein
MSLFGSLDLRPAADHPPGALREIWVSSLCTRPHPPEKRATKKAPKRPTLTPKQDWDGQYFCGRIPEVPHTLNVVGNVNELGVMYVYARAQPYSHHPTLTPPGP